jgi:hypothetical protein
LPFIELFKNFFFSSFQLEIKLVQMSFFMKFRH